MYEQKLAEYVALNGGTDKFFFQGGKMTESIYANIYFRDNFYLFELKEGDGKFVFVEEGLGYALCLDKLIHTQGTSLCFRPLSPRLEASAYVVWKKYQVFSKAADTFLACLQKTLAQESQQAQQPY